MCRPILKESASHLWLFWSSVGLIMRKENKWLGFIATACASVLLLLNSHSDSGWPWSASFPPKSHSMQSLHFRTGNMVQLNIGSTTEWNAQKMFLKRELTWIFYSLPATWGIHTCMLNSFNWTKYLNSNRITQMIVFFFDEEIVLLFARRGYF